MRLRELLDQGGMRLPVLAGEADLDRPLRLAYTTDLLDPARYLTGGELVLTGLMWRRSPADSERFVTTLARAGVAALGAGEALLGCVPADLVEACRRHRLPLFAVPAEVSFREVTDRVTTGLWAEREAGALAARRRYRGLVAALAAGAELAEVWPADLDAWVLTSTGRIVAGGPLDAAPDLALAYLAADNVPTRCTLDGREFQLAGLHDLGSDPHGGLGRPASASRLGARFVAAAAGVSLDELVSLAALDCARQERALQVERRLAAQLVDVLSGASEPAELNAALHACGLSPMDTHVVVVASLADHTPAVSAVEEMVYPSRVVAGDAERTVAVVATTDAAALLATLRRSATLLTAPARAVALRIGVSRPVPAAGLPAALVEATHAHAYALRRPGRAQVVGGEDVAARDLLLAGLPPSAREAFAERLLGPLLAYDASHNAGLVRTLRTFLDCNGSWTRCASIMHLHVNTLRYRIARISALTGRDLDRFADRVDLYLALQLHGD